jgi:hypothetical protein
MSEHPQWNVDRIWELVGDNTSLIALLKRHGVSPPSRNLLNMWRYRRMIGPAWVATILYCLLEEGLVSDIHDLIDVPAPV